MVAEGGCIHWSRCGIFGAEYVMCVGRADTENRLTCCQLPNKADDGWSHSPVMGSKPEMLVCPGTVYPNLI